MTDPQLDTRASLDLLVLKTLLLAPQHGWGIGQRIEQLSQGSLLMSQGSLYPALQRLESKGFVTSDWQTTDHSRRARVYAISKSGRRALEQETRNWQHLVAAVDLVLRAT
jgi:transcriptional regulator